MKCMLGVLFQLYLNNWELLMLKHLYHRLIFILKIFLSKNLPNEGFYIWEHSDEKWNKIRQMGSNSFHAAFRDRTQSQNSRFFYLKFNLLFSRNSSPTSHSGCDRASLRMGNRIGSMSFPKIDANTSREAAAHRPENFWK